MEGARPARSEDLPRLAGLARELIDELAAEKGGAVWRRHAARTEPLDATLAADLADPATLALAGTIDSSVVGYAVASVVDLDDGGRLAVVRDLYVEAPARGVGVGAALLDAVLAWARDQGCLGVDALALPGSRATKNFFEGFGLVARAIVVHRGLEPPA